MFNLIAIFLLLFYLVMIILFVGLIIWGVILLFKYISEKNEKLKEDKDILDNDNF